MVVEQKQKNQKKLREVELQNTINNINWLDQDENFFFIKNLK